jgi:hypothetical protein
LLHCSVEGRWCQCVRAMVGIFCIFVVGWQKNTCKQHKLAPNPPSSTPVVCFPPQPQPPPHLLYVIATRGPTLALPPSTNAAAAVQCSWIQFAKSNTTRSQLFKSNLCFQARNNPTTATMSPTTSLPFLRHAVLTPSSPRSPHRMLQHDLLTPPDTHHLASSPDEHDAPTASKRTCSSWCDPRVGASALDGCTAARTRCIRLVSSLQWIQQHR